MSEEDAIIYLNLKVNGLNSEIDQDHAERLLEQLGLSYSPLDYFISTKEFVSFEQVAYLLNTIYDKQIVDQAKTLTKKHDKSLEEQEKLRKEIEKQESLKNKLGNLLAIEKRKNKRLKEENETYLSEEEKLNKLNEDTRILSILYDSEVSKNQELTEQLGKKTDQLKLLKATLENLIVRSDEKVYIPEGLLWDSDEEDKSEPSFYLEDIEENTEKEIKEESTIEIDISGLTFQEKTSEVDNNLEENDNEDWDLIEDNINLKIYRLYESVRAKSKSPRITKTFKEKLLELYIPYNSHFDEQELDLKIDNFYRLTNIIQEVINGKSVRRILEIKKYNLRFFEEKVEKVIKERCKEKDIEYPEQVNQLVKETYLVKPAQNYLNYRLSSMKKEAEHTTIPLRTSEVERLELFAKSRELNYDPKEIQEIYDLIDGGTGIYSSVNQFWDKTEEDEREEKIDFINFLIDSDLRQGDLLEAIKGYNLLIDIDPKDPENWNIRGYLKEKLNLHEEAIKDFDQAIELNPNEPKYWNNRGYVKIKLNRWNEAYDDLNKTLGLDIDFVPAYKNRSQVMENLGNEDLSFCDDIAAISYPPDTLSKYDDMEHVLSLY